MSRDPLDWEAIGRAVGSVESTGGATEPGRTELGGSSLAREALAMVLGAEELRRMVDWYVAGASGAELVRSVLWLLHPWEAMDRCHELWASDADLGVRRAAVELLRVVADGSVLPWVPGLLADPDAEIRDLGIQVVDQLVFAELVEPEDVVDVLLEAARHPDPAVRERARATLDGLRSGA